ncbi:MAG: SDR family NAD(P)-dependent oxidoreductase [Chloroflexota bacterium]
MVLEALNLDGRSAVVTGGGTGLGREMVRALSAAGSDIVVVGRRQGPIEEAAGEAQANGRRGIAVPTDVTDTAQVEHLFQTAFSELGKVDVLINNAGVVRGQGGRPIWDITDEEWTAGIEANLSSAFYCSRAVARHMVDRGSGKIINVASGYGLRGARDNYMYGAGKGGVVNFTRSLAVSLGRHGVTANCIVPGFFPTEATTGAGMELPGADFIPVGRPGDPREVGPVAVWLASPASDYMTGELFIVDGGGMAGGIAPTGYAPEAELE